MSANPRTPPVAPLAPPAPPPAELVAGFESLGDNCEFGLFQRYLGAEPLGFFRFNFARISALRESLASRFAGLADPGRITLETSPGGEYLVQIAPHGFSYHTCIRVGEMPPGDLLAREHQRVTFLARKLIEDLEEADKIFVRKDNTGATEAEMREIAALLRGFGRNTLLWVVKADAQHPAGCVERLREGLLKAHLGWFAPLGTDVHSVDAESWLEICQNAWRLLRLPGTIALHPSPRAAGRNLLPDSALLHGRAWHGTAGAETEIVPPPPRPGYAVRRHQLHAAMKGAASQVFSGDATEVSLGRIHSVSAWVFISRAAPAAKVWVTLLGLPSLVVQRADPRRLGEWQRIWSSARARPDQTVLRAALNVSGPAGCVVYSTDWRLEDSVVPTAPAAASPPAAADSEFVLIFDGNWRGGHVDAGR